MNKSNSTNATNSTSNGTKEAAPEKKSKKKDDEESLVQQNATEGVNASNSTNSTHNKTKHPKLPPKPLDPPNKAYKESKFIKTTTYPIGVNEILLRITNLDDRFDGKTNEDYIYFDVNTFARELYLEANEKNMSKSQKK